MAKIEKRKRLPVFYIIFSAAIVLFGIVALIGLNKLNSYLEDFEASQPKYVAEEIASVFVNRDFDTVYEWIREPDSGEDFQENYVRYLNESVEDPITFEEVYTQSDAEKRYLLYGNGNKFAAIVLKTSGERSKYGFDLWAFDHAECFISLSATAYTIRTDDKALVYVNGELLGADSITETTTENETSWLNKDEVLVHTYCVYTCELYDELTDFELRVETADGEPYPIEETGENAYEALILYDESCKTANKDISLWLAKRYAMFMSGDLARKPMLNCCIKGTDFYRSIEDYDTRWFTSHTAYRFDDMVAENFIPLNSGAYSCKVSFNFYMKNEKGNTECYPTAYQLYVVWDGSKWKLNNVELASTTGES